MKKVQVCKNCNTENPFYALNCQSCNAYLRPRIVNIDLWSTIWNLLESPIKASETIIHAEHKNFIYSLLILAAFKIGINSLVLSNAFKIYNEEIYESISLILYAGIIFTLSIIGLSFIVTKVNNLFGLQNRFHDNFALAVYSFLPQAISLIILTPIHIALFGLYWYSFNPSPIMFKPLTAYVIIFIEFLFLLWDILLVIVSVYAQSKNIFYSIIVGLISLILLTLLIYSGLWIFFS